MFAPTRHGNYRLAPAYDLSTTNSGHGTQEFITGTAQHALLQGLAGVTVARQEGLDLNLLGLGFGVDINNGKLCVLTHRLSASIRLHWAMLSSRQYQGHRLNRSSGHAGLTIGAP